MIISSIHNPLIKQIIKLQTKARERKKTGLFVLEGQRELSLAIQAGYHMQQIFYTSELFDIETLKNDIDTVDVFEIETDLYAKLAYRKTTEGVLVVAKNKEHKLDTLKFSDNPFILIAESPEKPGNIGALLRTADAVGIDAVIIANPTTELYNPNTIRSSVGTIFTNQIAEASSEEVIAFLQKNQINCFTAMLEEESENYLIPDYTKPCAIVVGTEATGLSKIWQDISCKKIAIPMHGQIDSMNVSVSAGILLYEVRRQRE